MQDVPPLVAPDWLLNADSRTLHTALTIASAMAAEPKLLERRGDTRARYGALTVADAAHAVRPHAFSADLAAFAVDVADQPTRTVAAPRRAVGSTLAHGYVSRGRWSPQAGRAAAAVALATLLGLAGMQIHDVLEARRAAAIERTHAAALDGARRDAAESAALFARLQSAAVPDTVAGAVEQLRRDAAALMAERETALDAGVDPTTLPALAGTLRAMVARSEQWVALADRTPSADRLPTALRPLHARLSADLDAAIAAADLPAASASQAAITQLASLATRLAARPTRTVAATADARAALAAASARVASALEAGDLAGLDAALGAETDLHGHVAAEYTLRIVDRAGEKTGTERCPANSGRHRLDDCPDDARTQYYLIVEPVDASGTPRMVTVLDEETQRPRQTNRFAIRVPREVYMRYRDEKLRTHRIADRHAGSKPAGHLAAQFGIPGAVPGGTITEW